MLLAGGGEDDVVRAEIHVHQPVAERRLTDVTLQIGELLEVPERPRIETVCGLGQKRIPMPGEPRVGIENGTRQLVVTLDPAETIDEQENALDVGEGERGHRHAPLDPLDHQCDPVTIVHHADQTRVGSHLVEDGQDLALATMHGG